MVIAVDFDGSICEHAFPHIGKPRLWFIEELKKLKAQGHILIMWTCRSDNRFGNFLTEAVEYCKELGIEFDAVNKNYDDQLEKLFSRKVWADMYIDDKSVIFDDVNEVLVFTPTNTHFLSPRELKVEIDNVETPIMITDEDFKDK